VIILDTNIVSEFMTSQPAHSVLQWLNEQVTGQLYLTTITIAEITYGLGAMPEGKRQIFLSRRFKEFINKGFTGRILPFDINSAELYGEIMSHRKVIGRPMSTFDGQIAAIVKSTGFTLATRNVKDFQDSDIELINPFEPAP